jgi:WD40 repeat protein
LATVVNDKVNARANETATLTIGYLSDGMKHEQKGPVVGASRQPRISAASCGSALVAIQILSDSEVGNNHLCLWDYGVKEELPALVRKIAMDDLMNGMTGFAVNRRTDQIAVASMLGIRVLDPASLESIHTWKSHGDHVDSVTYASHSNTLASSGRDGLLRPWDATTFQPKSSLTAPRGNSIEGLSFVGDDSALCLVENGLLRIWPIARKADVKAAGW